MRIRTALGIAVAAWALAGCGPGNGLTMGRVSGLVTYMGEQVEFGEVLFVPDSAKGNNGVPSMGPIGKDGRYIMSTEEAGDGVIAGHHKVGIRVLDPEPVNKDQVSELDPQKATGKEMLTDRINRRKAQSLSRRKNRAKADAPTVSFNGRTHRYLTPERLANPETSGIRVRIPRGSNRVNFAIEEDGTVKVSQ
jgi:hypothetical protein